MRRLFIAAMAMSASLAGAQASLSYSISISTSFTSDGGPGGNSTNEAGRSVSGTIFDGSRCLTTSAPYVGASGTEYCTAAYGDLEDHSHVSANCTLPSDMGSTDSSCEVGASCVRYQDDLKVWSSSLAHGAKTHITISIGLGGDVSDGGNTEDASAGAAYEGTLTFYSYGPDKGEYATATLLTDLFSPSYGVRGISADAHEVPCWTGGHIAITCSLYPDAIADVDADDGGESVNAGYWAKLKTYVTPAAHVTYKAASGTVYRSDD